MDKNLKIVLWLLACIALAAFAAEILIDTNPESFERVSKSNPVVSLPGDCCLIPPNRGLYGREVPK